MYKSITIIFISCFLIYLPFSRIPDIFDSVEVKGNAVAQIDSVTHTAKVFIQYTSRDKKVHSFDPSYLFTHYDIGQQVKALYEESNPDVASVKRVWGYWIRWKEILACAVIYFLLFQLSLAMTKNPAPETQKELDDYANRPKRSKYNGNTF